jgi:hypothetical protein
LTVCALWSAGHGCLPRERLRSLLERGNAVSSWYTLERRARRALAANRSRIEAAHTSGTASERTLGRRGYDTDPKGGHKAPPQGSTPEIPTKRKRRRRTKRRPSLYRSASH